MSETKPHTPGSHGARNPEKFQNALRTIDGQNRASVTLRELKTLWINTGTLCNIECENCYIDSSPTNDRLAYIALDEVTPYLDEIAHLKLPTLEIGFTGGEPFMNPEIIEMIHASLERGFRALVLTNAMQPMLRPHIRDSLLSLHVDHPGQLTLRVSLDHHSRALHEAERGPGTWDKTLDGLRWLVEHGFTVHIAGRSCWEEDEAKARSGYARLFKSIGLSTDASDLTELVIFPEMDRTGDPPEITVDCWGLLGVDPTDMMCATSRMIVKHKGTATPTIAACTLLPYDDRFDLGPTLAGARQTVQLNHRYCAEFCVLGGGSCSGGD